MLYTKSKHVLRWVTFFSCRFWDTVEKWCRARQATDDKITLRKTFPCWITKAIETHAQNIDHLVLFHGNNDYAKAPQCYIYKYTASLVQYSFPLTMNLRLYIQTVVDRLHLLAVPDIVQCTVQAEANGYWTAEENSHCYCSWCSTTSAPIP